LPLEAGLTNAFLDEMGNLHVSPEQFEQYRTGYRCWKCHAAQTEPFPRECVEWYCRYPMRERQTELIEREVSHADATIDPDSDQDRRDGLRERGVWLPEDN
jgi:hypothetical protein